MAGKICKGARGWHARSSVPHGNREIDLDTHPRTGRIATTRNAFDYFLCFVLIKKKKIKKPNAWGGTMRKKEKISWRGFHAIYLQHYIAINIFGEIIENIYINSFNLIITSHDNNLLWGFHNLWIIRIFYICLQASEKKKQFIVMFLTMTSMNLHPN